METLLQHLDRFSEVLAVARTPHAGTWEPATVRRALQWARYLRHVHTRFGRHDRIRLALERRLQDRWKREGASGPALAPGLTNFQALRRCDLLLAVRLLENRALGDAARHYLLQQLFPGPDVPSEDPDSLQETAALLARRRSAVHLLHREKPALVEDSLMATQAQLLLERLREVGSAHAESFLSNLWQHLPRDNFLKVTAAALLLPPSPPPPARPPENELPLDIPQTRGDGDPGLLGWLLGNPDVASAFCRSLPAGRLTSLAGRHPELSGVYLGLLTEWGRLLRYDLQSGLWVGAEAEGVTWGELRDRFRSLCRAPPPLKDQALTALKALKAQDGGFEVPGLSIWTDLLSALGGAEYRPDRFELQAHTA